MKRRNPDVGKETENSLLISRLEINFCLSSSPASPSPQLSFSHPLSLFVLLYPRLICTQALSGLFLAVWIWLGIDITGAVYFFCESSWSHCGWPISNSQHRQQLRPYNSWNRSLLRNNTTVTHTSTCLQFSDMLFVQNTSPPVLSPLAHAGVRVTYMKLEVEQSKLISGGVAEG